MSQKSDEKIESVLKWGGWPEYFEYWDGFIKGWFECKKCNPAELPDDSLTSCLRKSKMFAVGFPRDSQMGLRVRSDEATKLNKEELPEPYYLEPDTVGCGETFDPGKVGLVVIQMNPAGAVYAEESDLTTASDSERQKYYDLKETDEGWLVGDFEKKCQKKYSGFLGRWSFYKNGETTVKLSNGTDRSVASVCGYDWWWSNNRREWLKRFAGCDIGSLFDIESVPYHSKQFNIGPALLNEDFKADFRSHLLQRVFLPAGICAQASRTKCVVCFGVQMRGFIESLQRLKDGRIRVSRLFKLTNGKPESCNAIDKEILDAFSREWPRNLNGSPIEKSYSLYSCRMSYQNQEGESRKCEFLLLSISANCMKFPSKDFESVEALLKQKFIYKV